MRVQQLPESKVKVFSFKDFRYILKLLKTTSQRAKNKSIFKGETQPPKRTGMSRAKNWSEEAEENFRFQEAGFLDRHEYESLFPAHQVKYSLLYIFKFIWIKKKTTL